MSFVGKILVVFQFVLAVLFVAFAGVVYTAHMNWRDDSIKKQGQITRLQADKSTAEQALESAKSAFNAQKVELDQTIAQLDAARKGLEQQVAQMKKENGDLQVARKTASEQAVIAGGESTARNSEALNQRGLNHELQGRLDKEYAARMQVEDKLASLELDYAAAKATNRDLLSQISTFRQALEAAGITADPTELANKNSPPPPLDGQVVDVKPARRQGASELVEISVGSNDGLKKGHEMTVFRSGLQNGQKPRYLARIVIVSTSVDKAVGQVIESSRNGVIQKGDNVSTKL